MGICFIRYQQETVVKSALQNTAGLLHYLIGWNRESFALRDRLTCSLGVKT